MSSFLFVYQSVDGEKRFAYVDRKNANAVSGSGIGGCICSIDDITILEDVVETNNFIISSEKEEKRISDDKGKYEFLLSLEPNLTEDQIIDKAVDLAMEAMKKK